MQVFYNESSWKSIAKYRCGVDARIRAWNGKCIPVRQAFPPYELFVHSTAVLDIRHDGIGVTEV